MKVLIIDNHTKHLKELISLFKNPTIVKKDSLDSVLDLSNYDLLVLSGGTNVPTVMRHPENYKDEINLILKSEIPTLGICLGAEMICKAFGGELEELIGDHRGRVMLNIEDKELIEYIKNNNIEVVEGHEIGVKKLPNCFISCAHSDHGVEIMRHEKLPIFGFQFHPELSSNLSLLNWVFKCSNIKI